MPERFDAIVVGTGFGGAVSACRLAETGAKVLVLERGRRWTKETYPRRLEDPWLYDPHHPEKLNGWLDLRFFGAMGGMAVAQGAGVGGGSNCYSSVVLEADPDRFASGWPPEVTFAELEPYYERIQRMLAVEPIPPGQRTYRFQLLQRAAAALGWADRVESVPLAISFDPAYSYDLPDPIDAKHSKPFTNAQGMAQGTCVHLGNCDIGCDVRAKNTLDLNYIAAAERHGAEVRPLHLVRWVEPAGAAGAGYRVVWDEVRGDGLVRGAAEAARVVLGAGSLGTTELLLRCRDEVRSLPQVSQQLGERWSANANFLAPSPYPKQVKVEQGIGPTISSGLNLMDGTVAGQRFYVQDDGFPNLLLNTLNARGASAGLLGWLLKRHLRRGLDEVNPTRQVMVWLGEGIDGADGRLYLGRRRLAPWQRELKLDWQLARSRAVIDAIVATHQRLAAVDGGRYEVPLWWRYLKSLVTVHPLGGCAMGRSRDDGVVDHRGEVFGYPNLFVADGSLLPVPTGRNPSLTIGALAERVAALMADGSAR